MSNGKSFSFSSISTLATPIRLVLGWEFFSAFLRRVVNDPQKLDPSSPAFMGHAFNHFLPHALFIKPMIEYLINNPHLLYIFLVTFTIIEGLVGIGLLFGLLTRLSAIGATLLSLGILLGSGWLGSTCVDEWQIGIAGISSGLVMFSLGGGIFSLDHILFKDTKSKLLTFLASNNLRKGESSLKTEGLIFSIIAMFITLYTYQALHGGLYGKLYNLSKVPKVEILNAQIKKNGSLNLTIYRTNGPDTYGAFVEEIAILDNKGNVMENIKPNSQNISKNNIKNYYFNKIEPNKFSLVVPLGAKATININSQKDILLAPGNYTVELIDVSGLKWAKKITLN
ncbi:Terminal quinol oxidase, subunit, putative (doxD-like) [Desulfurella amilsii]|uniref:Terminal quinol oxidase, subunit, putative (DoxD-like) n=1 Tax=Desulfurella amilsii TaxID=1562698 RepID=A0A1X4Y021_9BACT|nr:TQO small subunit DoxD [Desulfurella amilsii]OSS43141.1 Terminal quinol oxidase, subunit, putative (doxD-like) [Desulfurella amilsii]